MKQQELCVSENHEFGDDLIITHVSNFRPVKNVKNVILVFNNILRKLSSKLIMIGEGPEKKMAENLCKKLNIESKVIFLGDTNEVEKNLCHSDLFLLPSSTESFGLAALEAMASKVPVVSSNAGGLSEINIHGETGFLANPDDINSMTSYSIKIINDKKVLNDFKERAFKNAKLYDINSIVPMYEKIYEESLK